MVAYKLCNKKDGKYYPLYVNTKDEFIINEKYFAKEGEKSEKGKVKSKLGELAYRPGIHLSNIPLADHIGKRSEDGKLLRRANTAWLKCLVSDNINYTETANSNKKKCLETIPTDGFYFFNTNAQAKANWIIADWIIPVCELSREEEIELCRTAGFEAQELA